MPVDWDAVDAKLPTAATPAGQAARKEMFDLMDPNHNNLLTLTEVQAGLDSLFSGIFKGRNFRPAIKCAFAVSRHVKEAKGKGKAAQASQNNVDREEFHALLVAFRQYLELDVVFDSLDQDGDRRLCFKEVEKHLHKLEAWNLGDKAAVRRKFPDEWTESMMYDDFAEWCITRKLGKWDLKLDENDAFQTLKAEMGGSDCGCLLKAFEKWDLDGNGVISEQELTTILQALDPTFTGDMASELFGQADCNKDGMIDYSEFSKWIAADR